MATQSHILKADVGRASSVAWALLCALALIQVALVFRYAVTENATLNRDASDRATPEPGSIESPSTPSVPLPGQLQVIPPPPAAVSAAISPPPPGSLAPTAPSSTYAAPSPAPIGPPAVGSLALTGGGSPPTIPPPTPGSSFSPSNSPAPAPSIPAPAEPPSSNASITPPKIQGFAPINKVDEFIRIAREVRDLGDTQGALETLRRADLEAPDEPAILAETAITYEKMGLNDKAKASWKLIEELGAQKGGRHYVMASRILSGAALPGEFESSSGSTPTNGKAVLATADPNRALRLGTCLISRDTTQLVGERYVLRVPIIRESPDPINTEKVDIDVFFFDRVNGQKVELTIADEPISTWISTPVDWAGSGEEMLDIVYHLPQLSDTEMQAHGRRSYHGYVVKLYYQHRLQDAAAAPDDLLDFASPQPHVAGPENTLLPPVSQ